MGNRFVKEMFNTIRNEENAIQNYNDITFHIQQKIKFDF